MFSNTEFVFGRRVLAERAESYVLDLVSKANDQAKQPIPSEIAKTEQELSFIVHANHYLRQVLASFGLPYTEIVPEQIHFFRETDYERVTGNRSRGGYSSWSGAIYLNSEGVSRIRLYFCILHECVHAQSFQKIFFDWRWEKILPFWYKEMPRQAAIRVGYRAIYHDLGRYREQFTALNEILTDQCASIVLEGMRPELVDRSLLFEGERDELPLAYHDYLPLSRAVARAYGLGEQEAHKILFRGMFRGEMMHLRKVERFYGPGTLRIIASLGKSRLSRLERLLGKKIINWLAARGVLILPLIGRGDEVTLCDFYLGSSDEWKCAAIAKRLLDGRELRAWKKRLRIARRYAK